MTSLDILVVDDEQDLASSVADMLEADGHRVVLAHSAERALDLAQARAFDMVFLDIKLPGLSGVEILLPLRRALPGKKIVLMTGYRMGIGWSWPTARSAPSIWPRQGPSTWYSWISSCPG